MITDKDDVIRKSSPDSDVYSVILNAWADNVWRIPFTREGGYIATEIGDDGSDDTMRLSLSGYQDASGIWMQELTVIYFETLEKAYKFRRSPEGKLFGDRFSDGQDNFDFYTYAGDPRIPALMLTILKKHFDYKDDSPIVAHTYANIHYFRKDPDFAPPKPMES